MKKILFIRHAKSSWADVLQADFERPLNERGLRDAPFMATKIVEKTPKIDALYHSAAVRTTLTARYFCESWQLSDSQIYSEVRFYEASPMTMIQFLRGLPETQTVVAVVGHNPTMTYLANYFGGDFLANLPTCGVVAIAAAVEKWSDLNYSSSRLLYCEYPKLYFPKSNDD